jgi:hypothetical protein
MVVNLDIEITACGVAEKPVRKSGVARKKGNR